MKALLQRVERACVRAGGRTRGEIGPGLLILLGLGRGDSGAAIPGLVRKILNLRIFDDEAGKMNLSLLDTGGEALIVSQFTLYADCRKGNRPSYTDALAPAEAQGLYREFIKEAKRTLPGRVAEGEFGAEMKVELVNDGPVTVMLEV